MSAELLQRAAAVLREHAEKAQRSEPWCPEYTWAAVRHVQRNVDLDLDCVGHADDESCPSFGRYDGRYVAMMHPPVALALADWLEREALGYRAVKGTGEITKQIALTMFSTELGATIVHSTVPWAEAVARAILREPEEASTDA